MKVTEMTSREQVRATKVAYGTDEGREALDAFVAYERMDDVPAALWNQVVQLLEAVPDDLVRQAS